jgi:flagellar FliJ protein
MFRFNLEPVLKLRARTLERAQVALAESQRAEAAVMTRLKGLGAERERARQEFLARTAAGLKDEEYLLRRFHLDGLKKRIQETKQELAGCRKVVLKRRQELIKADREKKMVERLKEMAYQRYQEEMKLKELKALDEFSVLRFARAGGR